MKTLDIAKYVDRDNPIILEVGCNDGTDTNLVLQALPSATVYCFEPDPRAIERFKLTVQNPRAILEEAAISDEDGESLFFGSSGRPPNRDANHYCRLSEWDLSGSLCRPTGHLRYSPWVTFPKDRQVYVRTLRLDTWLAMHPHVDQVDFVWVDVQGAEGKVISGGGELLKRAKYLYTEHATREELYEGQPSRDSLLASLPGFEVVDDESPGSWESNLLLRNTGL